MPLTTPTRTVLIADDEAAIRAVVAAVLGPELPARVEEAADGRQAIRLLRRATPDLVLLDLLMPRLDGHGVIAYMREHHIDTPVIVISSVGEAASDLDPQLVRVVLQKPFEARDLRKVVAAVLEKV